MNDITSRPIRQSLPTVVAAELRQFILQNRFEPGQRLPTTAELASRFEVGTPTMREALRKLETMGLSMGGFGAWAMAMRQPQRFAALAPIAGGWDSERDVVPRNICDIKAVPIWVFHGAQDEIVPLRKAQLMVNALKQCGVEVRFTLYPDAKHRESFERTYEDPELYAWLFEQHLP